VDRLEQTEVSPGDTDNDSSHTAKRVGDFEIVDMGGDI
jgi:hypothetical protein